MSGMTRKFCFAAALAAFLLLPAAIANGRPYPDQVRIAERRDGPCHVTVWRNEIVHSVEITGLEPGEDIDLKLTYEGRVLELPIPVPRKGIVIVSLESKVRGESVGVGYVDFESRRCRIHLSYPWRSKT